MPGSQVTDEALNPVMPTGTSTHPEALLSEGQGHIVIDHKNLLCRNLIKAGGGRYRTAAQVHIGLRLEQKEPLSRPAYFGLPFFFPLKTKTSHGGHPVNYLESHIMPGPGIILTGITKTHQQTRNIRHD